MLEQRGKRKLSFLFFFFFYERVTTSKSWTSLKRDCVEAHRNHASFYHWFIRIPGPSWDVFVKLEKLLHSHISRFSCLNYIVVFGQLSAQVLVRPDHPLDKGSLLRLHWRGYQLALIEALIQKGLIQLPAVQPPTGPAWAQWGCQETAQAIEDLKIQTTARNTI